jgi:hypothetical protein
MEIIKWFIYPSTHNKWFKQRIDRVVYVVRNCQRKVRNFLKLKKARETIIHNLFVKEVEQYKVELQMISKRTKEETDMIILLDIFNWKIFPKFNELYVRRCTTTNIENYLRLKAQELQNKEELWKSNKKQFKRVMKFGLQKLIACKNERLPDIKPAKFIENTITPDAIEFEKGRELKEWNLTCKELNMDDRVDELAYLRMIDPLNWIESINKAMEYNRGEIKEVVRTLNQKVTMLDGSERAQIITYIKKKPAKFIPSREVVRKFISAIAWFGNNPNSKMF